MQNSPLDDIERALDAARSPADWRAAAAAHDALSGAAEWRRRPGPTLYDSKAIGAAPADYAAMMRAGAAGALAERLEADLQRHLGDLADPSLYAVAKLGAPHAVEAFYGAVEAALPWLATHPPRGLGPGEALRALESHARLFGRTALLLSGGATWGFHHLGVVKALFEAALLPEILSGASTGAMIAAGVCTRNDQELQAMFNDMREVRRDGLRPAGLRAARAARALLDPAQLYAVLQNNVGPATFDEAFAHSGRALNISVSPVRHSHKPRLLTHLTTPHVLVASAALASSALPMFFPPVELRQRRPGEAEGACWPGELWVDGSLQDDLPKQRLGRLHNVNHFIVSQTNPHVLPFAQDLPGASLRTRTARAVIGAARGQGAIAAELARRVGGDLPGPLGRLTNRAHALMSQDYGGDIALYPPMRVGMLPKLMSNPTEAELAAYVLDGERTVWPQLARIRDQTRVGRAFDRALAAAHAARAGGPTAPGGVAGGWPPAPN
jgi:NTE family protein